MIPELRLLLLLQLRHDLQDLVTAAVHGRTQGLVSNLRALLGVLLEAKKAGGGPGAVDGLLVRVCEPVLFRALAASNPAVRRNALQLLLDAFPLLVGGAARREGREGKGLLLGLPSAPGHWICCFALHCLLQAAPPVCHRLDPPHPVLGE